MKAIILSAGQGSRLLPLTETTPKCLLPVAAGTVLGHQVGELVAARVREIVVVTGFFAAAVEAELGRLRRPGLTLRTVFNPFYAVADNLGSCWMARSEMRGPFMLVNGDTLFDRAIPSRLMAGATHPVTLTIDRKDGGYDSDDMKVALEGERLAEVGKQLAGERVDGESIGMSLYREDGAGLFVDALDSFMRTGAGVRSWYLKAIDALARQGVVGVLSIQGLRWCEVDFPHDLARARRLFGAGEHGRTEAGEVTKKGRLADRVEQLGLAQEDDLPRRSA